MSDPIDSLNKALLGRYVLERELGEGGMATVYLARDERHDRLVAIKVLKPELAASVGADRFLREIRTTANLRHPHIVPLFDSGEAGGFLFYVMPHIEGETLSELLEREGALPIDRALSIAAETAGALAYAHERDVVHRDIKPGNIMLESGHVVVTDFGIAGAMQSASDARLTQTGMSLGTPLYMSPEQALGEPARAASDQYSLACVLFEMVAGRPPFEGPTTMSVIAKHTVEAAPSLDSVRADTPDLVVTAVARALAKDPSDRFDDLATWRKALRNGDLSAPPVHTPGSSPSNDAAATNEASLAVLPIRCSTEDPDTRSFAEGLVEDMVSAFSRFSHLQVASLSASRQAASEQSDASEAGRKLGARYVLEGNVRRGADRLRLTMQLVNVMDGAHLWAETYDRKLDGDWFDLQDDLTATIVSTVADWHGVLIRTMKVAVRRKRPEELTPDEAVILTYVYWETESNELHAQVRTSLERAVEDDPHHSNAWACLAHMYIEEIKQGHNQLPDSAGRSLEAARRAVELDPSSSMAFDALAQAQFFGDDLSGFRSSAERAIALNPLAADVVAFMGQLLALSGEWERGLAHNRRARERNPNHPGWYYFLPFWYHFQLGEYEQALAAIQQVNMPVYYWAHLGLAAVNGQLGRESAARAAAAEAVKLVPDIADRVRENLRLWRLWEHCGPAYVEGLEKAGLAVTTATSSADGDSSETAVAEAVQPPSALSPETVAVLPFGHLSGEEAAMFAAGLHQDLLTHLSRSQTLTVISRTSVSRYRNTELTLPQIAETLGAGTIIEGDVQQSGERLRLNVRLVDAGTDHHLWAETFDRELSTEGLFDIQSELAGRIADSLQTELRAGQQDGAAGGPSTHDLEAYRLHAAGRALLDRRTDEGMRDALRCFHDALERDPAYAQAWVGVADAWGFLGAYGFELSDAALQEAEAAAQRALELDPGSAEAHASMGLISYGRRDGREALRSLTRAIELGPSYALPHSLSAYFSSLVGRGENTLAYASRAVELDPLSAESVANLSLGHLFSGSAETAVIEAQRVQRLQPEYTTGVFYEALARFELGGFSRVVALLDGLAVEWAGHGVQTTIALALAMADDGDDALHQLERLGPDAAPFATGLVNLALGDTDEAFSAFEQIEHWDDWSSLAVHHLYGHVWAPVREDPRYLALCRRALQFWGMIPEAGR